MDDLFGSDEPVVLRGRSEGDSDIDLVVTDTATGERVASGRLNRGLGEWQERELPPLPEGIYRATIQDAAGNSDAVSDVFAIVQN